tara:strand:+ start:4492 stop:5166 length:675 start_codon:yes stop_codon:yes gene_type:complete
VISAKELMSFDNKDGYTPHELIDGFIHQQFYEKLLESFPSDDLFKDEFPATRKRNQRPHCRRFMCYYVTPQSRYFDAYFVDVQQFSELWQELCDYILYDREYRDWVREALSIKDFHIRLDFHRTAKGLDVSPHVDSNGKYGSHLFYFTPKGWKEEYGGNTIFYKGKKIDAMNPEPEDFAESLYYPIIGNKSLLFKNTPIGWHGVKRINADGMHRQLFNVVILKK